MADISSVTLLDGNTYNLKDAIARKTTEYNTREGQDIYKTKTLLNPNMILLTFDDEYLLPTNTYYNATRTDKVLTDQPFNPFGKIYFYTDPDTAIQADDLIPAEKLYLAHSMIDLRYAFNIGTSLVPKKSVYLLAEMLNGNAVLHNPAITQTRPQTSYEEYIVPSGGNPKELGLYVRRYNPDLHAYYYILTEDEMPVSGEIYYELVDAEDGLLYIYLGKAYSNYQIVLSAENPVYMHRNGAFQVISGSAITTENRVRSLEDETEKSFDGIDNNIDALTSTVQEHHWQFKELQSYVNGTIYVLTEDTVNQDNITYYQRYYDQDLESYVYTVYIAYILTEDTEPVSGTVYYQRVEISSGVYSYNEYNVSPEDNPHELGLYIVDTNQTYNPQQLGLYVLIDDPNSLESRVDQNTKGITNAQEGVTSLFNTVRSLTNLNAEVTDGISSVSLGYTPIPGVLGGYYYGVAIGNNVRFQYDYFQTADTEAQEGVTYYDKSGNVYTIYETTPGEDISQLTLYVYAPISSVFSDDPRTYYLISPNQTFSLYTKNMVQFWVMGVLVGWFNNTNNRFHSVRQEVESDVKISSWQIINSNGLGIKYVGDI